MFILSLYSSKLFHLIKHQVCFDMISVYFPYLDFWYCMWFRLFLWLCLPYCWDLFPEVFYLLLFLFLFLRSRGRYYHDGSHSFIVKLYQEFRLVNIVMRNKLCTSENFCCPFMVMPGDRQGGVLTYWLLLRAPGYPEVNDWNTKLVLKRSINSSKFTGAEGFGVYKKHSPTSLQKLKLSQYQTIMASSRLWSSVRNDEIGSIGGAGIIGGYLDLHVDSVHSVLPTGTK